MGVFQTLIDTFTSKEFTTKWSQTINAEDEFVGNKLGFVDTIAAAWDETFPLSDGMEDLILAKRTIDPETNKTSFTYDLDYIKSWTRRFLEFFGLPMSIQGRELGEVSLWNIVKEY